MIHVESHILTPTALALREGDAHVWSASLALGERATRALGRLLSRDERERAERFFFALDRKRFIAAHGVLRMILARYTAVEPSDIAFVYGDHGKPRLDPSGGASRIEFNMSHCRDLALVAVALRRAIGVDIEAIDLRSYDETVVRLFFSPREREALRSASACDRASLFTVLWTRKEACAKASGLGLSVPVASFDAQSREGDPRVVAPDDGSGLSCTVADLDVPPGYAAACAVRGAGLRVRRREFSVEASARFLRLSVGCVIDGAREEEHR